MSLELETSILSSVYTLDSIRVQVGLKPIYGRYNCEISIVFKVGCKVSFNCKEFVEFKKLIFSPLWTRVDEKMLTEDPDDGCTRLDSTVANYNVSLMMNSRLVIISENQDVISEMPVEGWMKFLYRFSTAIDLSLIHISEPTRPY